MMKMTKKRPDFQNDFSGTLHQNLEFTAREQYKLLRTNLNFTLPHDEKCPVIGVTSSMRGEGKSTTAVNLSYVLAENGAKVLLIDGDLRIPSIAKKMGIEKSTGLTDLLVGRGAQLGEYRSSILDNWYILPAGDIPPNPSELLGSRRMAEVIAELRNVFDYIVVDLPPVNIVTDAVAISPIISGMIVVIREGYAQKKELERCFRQLELSNVKILGCVLNESTNGKGSYSKYKYKKYGTYKYYRYYEKHGYYETPKKEAEQK
ncbi:MAG: CpsD/CapB family tyrosine-protein kinase [Clostridia bacterium]|nr:CpsD/CapB family tyrosine-protein kinase [Clostridia bacterium]